MDVTASLLELAFPDFRGDTASLPHERRDVDSLGPEQRAVLSVLLNNDEAWYPSWTLDWKLMSLGLPGRRAELRELLETCPVANAPSNPTDWNDLPEILLRRTAVSGSLLTSMIGAGVSRSDPGSMRC